MTQSLKEFREIWNAVAIADPCGSEFYGLNDATAALHRLDIIAPGTAKGVDRLRVIRKQLNLRVQKILRLNTSAERAAQAFAHCMAQGKRRSVFISYAHADGELYALELARHLMHQGWSPWLDRLAIPGYDTENEEKSRLRRLQKLIQLGIEQSALGISVITDAYLKKKDECGFVWTRREWNQIVRRCQRNSAYRHIRVNQADRPIRPEDAPFNKRPARQVAAEITRWWHRQ